MPISHNWVSYDEAANLPASLQQAMDTIRTGFSHLTSTQSTTEAPMTTPAPNTVISIPDLPVFLNRFGDPYPDQEHLPTLVEQVERVLHMHLPDTQRPAFSFFSLSPGAGGSVNFYMYRKASGLFYRYASGGWSSTCTTPLAVVLQFLTAYSGTLSIKEIKVQSESRAWVGSDRFNAIRNAIITTIGATWSDACNLRWIRLRNTQAWRTPDALAFRGVQLSRGSYNYLRNTLIPQATELIREVARGEEILHDCDEARAEAMRDLLDNIKDYHARLASRISDAFNQYSSQEVYLCDCGHYELNDSLHYVGDDTCCESCFEDSARVAHTVYDARMRDVGPMWRRYVYYWDSDGEYHTEDVPEDEDEDSTHLLHSWGASTSSLNHDRTFTSSSQGEFIMGVELEVESKDYDRSGHLEFCDDHFNNGEFLSNYAMFKADGSLDSSRGFEIVTAARKLDDHLAMFGGWEPASGLHAWNAGNCGMHVHIDSRAFSSLTLGKFITFINTDANESLIRRIAGRHPNTDHKAQSYCAKVGQEQLDLPSKALKAGHTSRYRMVNLTNLSHGEAARLHARTERDCKGSYSTVELRIFRASLKKERLLAQIEFTHAAVMFCRTASYTALSEKDFKQWLAVSGQRYKHLLKWFGVTVVRANTTKPAVAELAEV